MLLGLYFLLVIALPVALALLVVYNGLPRSRSCPICAGETLRLRSRPHGLFSRLLRREALHARWCPSCEWSGTARVPRTFPIPARHAATPLAGPARFTGLEIRRVDLDDGPWRVRLECWAENGEWRGRLLFVGPEGRAWVEGRPLVTGRSAVEVLSKVLSLTDRTLVGRIRKATR